MSRQCRCLQQAQEGKTNRRVGASLLRRHQFFISLALACGLPKLVKLLPRRGISACANPQIHDFLQRTRSPTSGLRLCPTDNQTSTNLQPWPRKYSQKHAAEKHSTRCMPLLVICASERAIHNMRASNTIRYRHTTPMRCDLTRWRTSSAKQSRADERDG